MAKGERKLTEKELKRKARFEELQREMEQNGYQAKDMTVGVWQANLAAFFIMLPFAALLAWLYFAVNPGIEFSLENSAVLFLFYLLVFVLIVIHELIHGVAWGILAEDHFQSIEFGVIWKALAPYCTCSQPMRRWQYILGSLMPTLILGFGPGAASIGTGSFFLFCLSELMLFGGGGDFLIALKILLYRPNGKELVYCDHPYECGVVVFEK